MGDAQSKANEEDEKLAQQLQDEEYAMQLQQEEAAAAMTFMARAGGPPIASGSLEKLPHESDEEYATRLQALEVAAASLEEDMVPPGQAAAPYPYTPERQLAQPVRAGLQTIDRTALCEQEGDLQAGGGPPPSALLVLDCEADEARDAFLRRARTVRAPPPDSPLANFMLREVMRSVGPEPLACAHLDAGPELGGWLLPAAQAHPGSAFFAVDPLFRPAVLHVFRRTERTGLFSSRSDALLLTTPAREPPSPADLAAIEAAAGPGTPPLREFEHASSTPLPEGVLFPPGLPRPPNLHLLGDDFRRPTGPLPAPFHAVAATERAVPPGTRAVHPAASWRALASLLRAGGAAVRTHAPAAGDDPLSSGFAQSARVPGSPALVAWLSR